MKRIKKITRYFYFFVCFIFLLTIGEGCKNGSLSTSSSPPGAVVNPPVSPVTPQGTTATDSFEVTQSLTAPKVDILLVIDTSGSMEHHQQKLGERFGDLVSGLSSDDLNIDWQIAFTNADDSDPQIDADGYHGTFYNLENEDGELLIDGETATILTPELLENLDDSDDLEEIFYNTIDRSGKSARENGEDSGVEAPLRNIKNAISKRNNENSGFFRDSATLVTVILSNENEFSDGQAKSGIEPTTAANVTQAVSDAFGANKRFFTYGIIVKPDDTECRDAEETRSGRESPTYGTFIDELAIRTYSICEENYSGILLDIASHLEATLTLSSIPFRFDNVIESSITLTFTPAENEQTGSFDASSNTYTFDEKPANGTTIRVEYQYSTQ